MPVNRALDDPTPADPSEAVEIGAPPGQAEAPPKHAAAPAVAPPKDGQPPVGDAPGGPTAGGVVAPPESDDPAPDGAPPESDDPPAATAFVQLLAKGVVGLYLVTAAVLALLAFVAHEHGGRTAGLADGRWSALAFGVGVIGVGLLILQLLGGQPSKLGIFRPLVGGDKRFSTSLTQLGIWTIAAGTGFGYLLGRAMFDGADLNAVLPGDRWDEYLILLGGPFAAAVLAKGIVTYKLDAGTLQPSEPPRTAASQVVTSNTGSVDLVDAQYLIFNVIALGYFVVKLASTSILPEMPSTMLAMTSATAGVFVANKAAQRNAPSILSVSPRTALPGAKVVVLGTNFDPGEKGRHGNPDRRIHVNLTGCVHCIYSQSSSDTRFEFAMPSDATTGPQTLILTSTAGVETEPRELTIAAKPRPPR